MHMVFQSLREILYFVICVRGCASVAGPEETVELVAIWRNKVWRCNECSKNRRSTISMRMSGSFPDKY